MRARNSHEMKRLIHAARARFAVGGIALLAVVVSLALLVLSASNAFGAGETGSTSAVRPWNPFEMMGITGMKCRSTYTVKEDERFWLFQSEPEITALDPDGAAKGKLKVADVIVAIDGLLITTRKAGERLAAIEPGEPVTVTVRRGGKTVTETIVPGPAPVAEKSRLKATIAPPPERIAELSKSIEELARVSENLAKQGYKLRADVLELPELPELPDMQGVPGVAELNNLQHLLDRVLPQGWLGFGLSFRGQVTTTKEGKRAEWDFEEPPKIHSIEEGGPAEDAGLKVGDVITRIDGIKIDSNRGGERFAAIEPAQKIVWTIERGGVERSIEMTAGERPEPEVLAEPEVPAVGVAPVPEDQPVQYTGKLGDAEVEVRGAPTIRVTVDEERGVIVIRSRDAVTRLRMTKKP